MSHLKPLGQRVLVRKERLDAGGLKLTPTQEQEGMKNTGTIIAIGQVGFFNWLRGVRVGAKIRFRKYFVADDETNPAVFVDVENITAIER